MPLSEILAVDTATKNAGGEVTHCFEIRTANVDFFVGEDSAPAETEAGEGSATKEATKEWEAAIKNAFKPVVSTGSTAGQKPTEEPSQPEKATKPAAAAESRASGAAAREKEGKETEISQAYQIFPDEVLGSGQFGIVYGGVHRISARPVAIKVVIQHIYIHYIF